MCQTATQEKKESRKKKIDINNPRINTIIKMFRQRHTLSEIAKHFSLTRARIKQILKNDIIPAFGQEILEPQPGETRLYSVDEIAQELGESRYIVLNTIKKEKIQACLRGERFFLTRTGVNKLKAKIEERKKGKCAICGQEFDFHFPRRGRYPEVCYKTSCKKKYDGQRAYNRRKKEPADAKFAGWHLALWEKMKTQPRPEGEIWLSAAEAAELSRLTISQISYLRIVKLLKTQPHPTEKIRNVPCHQYSYHDVLIAGQVWREFVKGKANG